MSFSEWKEIKLGELLNFRRGHDLPKKKMLDGNIPVVGSNGIIGFHNEVTTKAPCLTIGRSGNIGNPCYINKDCWAHNTSLYVDDFKGNDPKYLYYLLKTLNLGHYGGGSAVPTLNRNHIHPIEIKATINLAEQKAIAHILSTLDDKIEVNNQINKTLENMAHTIFKQWFVDFEFPNEDGEPYKSSGGEMVESELGMIPKGWGVKSLCDIARIDTKSIKPFENGDVLYEHYSIPALDANNYPNFEYGREIKSNKYKVFEDSILISKLNPSKKRIWLPLYLSNRAICSTEFLNFRPCDTRMKAFVYSIIDSTRFTEFLMNHVTGSTGSRQRVKPQDTLSYKFAMPNSDMLQEFCEVIDGIYTKRNNNLNENQNIKKIRDTLLPKLMSGEIRVPLDDDGDAS